MVRAALERIANAPTDEDLDSDDCCEALAAAELVAAALGRATDRLPADEGPDWVAAHGDTIRPSDRDLARVAVERIGARSELQELWDEGGRNEEWHGELAALVTRLAS